MTVDGVKYASLSEAIAVAGEGAEMSLIADVAESVTVLAGKNIVLDLAGFTLTGGDNGKGGVNNTITNKGVLTIKDSSAAKTGAVMGGTDTGSGTAGSYRHCAGQRGHMHHRERHGQARRRRHVRQLHRLQQGSRPSSSKAVR